MDPELLDLLKKAEEARRRGASLAAIDSVLSERTEGRHGFRSLAELAKAKGLKREDVAGTSAPSRSAVPGARDLSMRDRVGNTRSALMSAAHGATFGLLDDVVGLVSRRGRDNVRETVERTRREHPVRAAALEGAGALATGGAALRAPALGAAARAHPMMAGAAAGGVYGFGEAEGGPRERAAGAGVGAAVGATLPGAARAGGALARGAARAVTRSGTAAERTATRAADMLDDAATRSGQAAGADALKGAGLNASLLRNRPADLRSALQTLRTDGGEEAANNVRSGLLRRVVEDIEAGDISMAQLRQRGLPRLRAILPHADVERVERMLDRDASAERIAGLLRSLAKIGAGTGAGLGLLDAVLGGR